MKQKIEHWLIMEGSPNFCGLTRKSARTEMQKIKNGETFMKKHGTFKYIGKCIIMPDGKHSQIILDF